MQQSPTHPQTAAPALSHRLVALWRALTETSETRRVAAALFVFSTLVLISWRLFVQMEVGDAAIWDYVAQAIRRGQIPYRDVVEIKGPASAYLSALAMALGHAVGVRDVMAVRFMQILMTSALGVISYLIGESYLRQRVAALIACLFPLTSYHFVSWIEGGTQPKLTMIFFGMLSLLLIARDKPFWAGVAAMMSCLCWQPGLLFAGVAFLVFSRYLTSWRDGRAFKVVAGALVPLAVVVVYFYSVGALSDLWTWTVAYNFNVYAPAELRSLTDMLAHLWAVTLRIFKVDVAWVILAFAGLIWFAVERLRAKRPLKAALQAPDLFKDALVIAPAVYLAFCLINFQSGPDFLPFFPFVGLFAGWLICEAAARLRPRRIEWLPALALLLILLLGLGRAVTFRMQEWTLKVQEQQLKAATDRLAPEDKVYVHGTVELLVLTNRANLNPYILWDRNKAEYIAAKKYGGSVAAMIAEMEGAAPKLVAISRLRNIPQAVELERWVATSYERLPIIGYDIYVRKQQ
ncbi:MAG TPA: DolP-mannose mannosyltransferase [Blastocatellia bacterium]|nr:DolP-mannose mannosyltransferase [Blastocatellia bacterium]